MSSRLFSIRSAIRAASRQSQSAHFGARRGYASQHGASKSSDMPWLIGAVGVTVPGAAYLLSNGPVKAETHGASAREEKGESPSSNDDPGQTSLESAGGDDDGATPNKAPQKGDDKTSSKAPQPGQDVPPPSSDNTSMAENFDEKKQKHEDYKETMEKRDTKVATSSSDMPSKKTGGEHPREDPQKGEGEAKQKGGSNSDE